LTAHSSPHIDKVIASKQLYVFYFNISSIVKLSPIVSFFLFILVLTASIIPGCTSHPPSAKTNTTPKLIPEEGMTTYPKIIAISAGYRHSLALLNNGTVIAWGLNSSGETEVPDNLTDVSGISAGNGYSIAVKKDGSVTAWGCRWNSDHRNTRYPPILPRVPIPCDDACPCKIPSNLTQVKAVSAGWGDCVLALMSDGTVISWGRNDSGNCAVPHGLKNVTAISAGYTHSLALKDDGSVVAWGAYNGRIPLDHQRYSGMTLGFGDSLLLNEDGTLSTFTGTKSSDHVPLYHPPLSNVTAISSASCYYVALLENGSVINWMCGKKMESTRLNTAGKNLTNVIAISAGSDFTLALKNNGKVVAWGNCGRWGYGCQIPAEFAV
jgi:alpha-tubulin suppressor-like RCC1 family protein